MITGTNVTVFAFRFPKQKWPHSQILFILHVQRLQPWVNSFPAILQPQNLPTARDQGIATGGRFQNPQNRAKCKCYHVQSCSVNLVTLVHNGVAILYTENTTKVFLEYTGNNIDNSGKHRCAAMHEAVFWGQTSVSLLDPPKGPYCFLPNFLCEERIERC
jgi:hypothetical protein